MAEAREILDLLDAGDAGAIRSLLPEHLQGWDAEPWVRDYWVAGLETMLGAERRVARTAEVRPGMHRFWLEGERGTAVATVLVGRSGVLGGMTLAREEREGIANIVLQCPWNEDRERMTALYGDLLGLDTWSVPRLVFDEGVADDPYRPRWPDPAFPQQLHLDIRVPDLDAADALVLERGATHLGSFDDHRVYEDIVGHPFCLYPADVAAPVLWRLVIDGRDPDALQAFYEGLFGPDTTPALAFQHSDAEPPRFPDPAHPAQIHVDLMYDDPAPVAARILDLGGTIVQRRDRFTIYGDPAGHPFCLGRPGE